METKELKKSHPVVDDTENIKKKEEKEQENNLVFQYTSSTGSTISYNYDDDLSLEPISPLPMGRYESREIYEFDDEDKDGNCTPFSDTSVCLDEKKEKESTCPMCIDHKSKISELEKTVSDLKEEIQLLKKANSKYIEIEKEKMEMQENIKSLKKFIDQTQETVKNLTDELERKNKIIKEKSSDKKKNYSPNLLISSKKEEYNKELKKKLSSIKSKLLRDNLKPLKKRLSFSKKLLKGKEKEISALKTEIDKMNNMENHSNSPANNENRNKKKESKKAIFSFLKSKSLQNINKIDVKDMKSGVPRSIGSEFVSQHNKLEGLLLEKKKLQEKVNELSKIKDIFTDKKMINFFYGNSDKNVKVRSYIGFSIKESVVSESSDNEVNFFNQAFKSESNYSKKEKAIKEKVRKNNQKLFGGNGLKKEDSNRIVKYYGFWKKKEMYEEYYCIALERGRCDLSHFFQENKSDIDTKTDSFQFQKTELCVQNSEKWILNLMKEICLGVKVLHDNGISHNDLKPENILVCEDFRNSSFLIKLMDFESIEKIPCLFKVLRGTPNWICPNLVELKTGKEDKFSLERDIFSLGAVLCFVLFKQNVFNDLVKLLKKTVNIFMMINLPHILCKGIKNGEKVTELDEIQKLKDENNETARNIWIRIEKCKNEKNYFYLFNSKKEQNNIFNNKLFVNLKNEIISCFSMDERKRSNVSKLIKVIDSCLQKVKDLKKKEKTEMKKQKKVLKEKNKEWKKKEKVEKNDYSHFGLFKKEVVNWKNKEVVQWLTDIVILEKEDFNKFVNVDGNDLLNMNKSDLSKKGIESSDDKEKFLRELNYLKEFGYSFNETRVLKKITKHIECNSSFHSKDIINISKCLSNEKNLMNSYLKVGSEWSDIFERKIDTKDENDINADPTKNLKDNERGKLPVKLVVTELHINETQKKFRKVFSPVFSKIKSFSKKEFGIFHTAIIVGPWYLEWVDNSLCIPRKLCSSMALISADLDTTSLLQNLSIFEIKEKISKVVVFWNTRKHYCNINMYNRQNFGNCQDFVEDIMSSLEISLKKEGTFGKFFEKMKNNGRCEMIFSPPKKFISVFKLKILEIKFEKHLELDNFVNQCSKVDEMALTVDFKEEYKLLKSFDRAFWLRHLKDPSNEKFKPCAGGCPFKDPRLTKSYFFLS